MHLPAAHYEVAVVGGGLMGCGIASLFALAGFDVLVYDSEAAVLERVKENCAAVFVELAVAKVITQSQVAAAEAKVHIASSLASLSEASLVFEAIVESVTAKQALYQALEDVLSPRSILASTTSSIVPEVLGEGLRRPSQFAVAHFWNPPHIIKLVEVVPSPETSAATLATLIDRLTAADCKPVLLRKSAPGFIGNRLQFAVLREALSMLRAGIADAETIDEVMKQSLGRRYRWIGPLEGADIGGLDTFLAIGSQLLPHLSSDAEGLEVLRALVDKKRGGRRDGHGIYLWDVDREVRLSESRLRMLTEALHPAPGSTVRHAS